MPHMIHKVCLAKIILAEGSGARCPDCRGAVPEGSRQEVQRIVKELRTARAPPRGDADVRPAQVQRLERTPSNASTVISEEEEDVEEEAASAYFDGDMRMLVPLPELDAFNWYTSAQISIGFDGITTAQILRAIAEFIRDEVLILDAQSRRRSTLEYLLNFLRSFIDEGERITTTRVTNDLRALLGGIYNYVTHTPTGRMQDLDFKVKHLYHRLGPKPYEDTRPRVRTSIRGAGWVRLREIDSWLATNIYRLCIREYDVGTYGPLTTMQLGSIVGIRPVVLIDDEIKNKFDVAYLLRMHPACTGFQIVRDYISDRNNIDDERKHVMRTWFWWYHRIMFEYQLIDSMESPELAVAREDANRNRTDLMISSNFNWGAEGIRVYMHIKVRNFWNHFNMIDAEVVNRSMDRT